MRTQSSIAQHWTDELAEAPRDTVNRLRYAFPDLGDAALLRMARMHPEVERVERHCRRQLATCKRTRKPGARREGVRIIEL